MLTSKGQLRLLPTGSDDRGTALRAQESTSGKVRQFRESLGAEVAKLVLFPVRPKVFDRIELWGIGGQECKLQRARGRINEVAHQSAAMRREVVPDDEELALEAHAQLFQELEITRSLLIVPG